jgi:methylated-DNA-[protein]-cysteine S-methyltransferase
MTSYLSTVDTQLGPFTVVVDEDGSVLASGWTADVADLLPQVHPRLRAQPQPRADLGVATRAVVAYHRGELDAPDAVAVHQENGGEFLPAAWKTLREVRAGEQITYTELAARTGNPAAVRAAAQACARNAAALFVPCHRVVRTDGTLGGFRWGLPVKSALLLLESR